MRNLFVDVLTFLGRLVAFLYVGARLMALKSKAYRWVWQRQYKDTPLKRFSSFLHLSTHMRPMRWRQDTLKELWDAVSEPGYIQHLMDQGNREIGDCDDFAVYLAAVIKWSMRKGSFLDSSLHHVCLFSAMWLDPTLETGSTQVLGISGHSVCGLKWIHEDGAVEYGYMDYGMPIRRMKSWDEVAEHIRQRYTRQNPDTRSLGWCRNTTDLKLLEYSWK